MTVDFAADDMRLLGPGDAIAEGAVIPYYLKDVKRRVSVARVGNMLFSFDDMCPCGTELPCPLSGGLLEDNSIMCQCHGSRFDLATGAVLDGPATQPLTIHAVQELDGAIHVCL